MNAVAQPSLVNAMVVGAGMGAVIGSYPAATARSKGRIDLAVVSVVGCTIAGALGGCILAFPLAWVLTSWINGLTAGQKWDESRRERRRTGRRGGVDTPPPVGGPYTELGTLVVCNKCKKATGKVNGEIPVECGHCGRVFLPDIVRATYAGTGRTDELVELWKADDRPRRR